MAPQPADSLIQAAVAELRRHAPFDAMDAAELEWLAARLSLHYFARGETLLGPDSGPVQFLYLVQRGSVVGADAGMTGDRGGALTLSEGECFPIGALIARRPSTLRFSAERDTFCYRLALADFEHLMDVSRPFRDFASRRLAALLEQSRRQVQGHYTARTTDAHSLASPLKSILRRPPVTATPATPIRLVLETMRTQRIGSVVVVDAAGAAVGIFTERDVLERVALGGMPQDTPIERVMTPSPFSLPAHAPLFEAAQAMARHRFRHVLVSEEGALRGVVSERDLFTLQRLSLGSIAKLIEDARDVEALSRAAADVRGLAAALLAQGVGAEQLTQFVTTFNDALAGRALALAATRAPPPNAAWCWLGLGSEGRMEQTLATDQDNALIFVADAADDVTALRSGFLRFADEVNAILDSCGFPLCKGDIMARNPRWCLTPQEWKDTFGQWLRGAQPEALLNAAIFFDFRPLHGDAALAIALREWLSANLPAQPLFLRQMAQNAIAVRPPLGLLRDFVADDGDFSGTIDLKQMGARPFIDAARILALKNGVSATNTAERIRLVAPRIRMAEDEAAAMADAFHFVQLLRLRQQESGLIATDDAARVASGDTVRQGPALAYVNRINPDLLNPLDRRILKESLRQARKLQTRLELDFQL